MAINVIEQYNGGFLPDITLLTISYYHQETACNAMKSFCPCSLCFHLLNVLIISPLDWADGQKVLMSSDLPLKT